MSDKAANVVEALSNVIADMPAIGKDAKASDQQGGYRYRGIEAITSELQRLLGKHGVVFVPHVLDWQTDQLTVNGKPWTDTRLRVEYEVFGPGGVEDRIVVGPICAIGRDNSDKGANKAMTQAFKYALLQTLCIGDAKDDGDQASHEADEKNGTAPHPRDIPLGDVATMHPREVRDALQARGLPCDGKVDELRERLAQALGQEPASQDHAAEPDHPSVGEGQPGSAAEGAVGPDDAAPPAAPGPAANIADPKAVQRLQVRLDKLPDETRRDVEDLLAEAFDGRFPNELLPADVPEVGRVIDDAEAAAKPGADLAHRAASHAKKAS